MSQLSQPSSINMEAVSTTPVHKHIIHALLSISSAALLIRVIGMINQVVVSARFGAGAAMDAYFVASLLPLLIAQLIFSTLEVAIIPTYTKVSTQGTKKDAALLFSTLLNLLLIGAIILTLVMLIFRRQALFLSAPALDVFRMRLATDLAPFIFPVLVLMVVLGFMECILNAEGQFAWPAYAGILVPLTTALLALLLGESLGVVALCVGMLMGSCLQLCVFIVRIRSRGLVYRPIIDIRNPAISTILTAAWPVFIGTLISQANPFVDQIVASFLSIGNISALNYSFKIISVPIGVIFISVGRAALPYLSRQASIDDMKAFKETLRLYLWIVAIGTTILTAFIIGLAHPLVQILFQRGAFSANDTNRTANTLIAFAVGLTPMSLGFITSRAFSALGKTRILLGTAIFSIIANAVLDYILAQFWQSTGIALATSAVYLSVSVILLFTLRFMIGKLDIFILPPELLQVIRRRRGMHPYHRQQVAWKQENRFSFSITPHIRQQLVRVTFMLAAFAAGVVGVFLNSVYTLRAAFGSLVILAFMRYRYALLLAWVLVAVFIGSTLQIFNGNNFLTGLTVPTLLLLFSAPIRRTFKRMPALTFFLLYLLWVFAGIGISAIGIGPFLTLWFTALDYMAVAVLTIHVLTTSKRLVGLIDVILLVSMFIALYGIYGYITGQNGIQDPISKLFRIMSTFGSSPTLALFLSFVIPLSLYRILISRGFRRIVNSVPLLFFVVALGLTFTRSTYIIVPLSMLMMLFFLPSRKTKVRLLGSVLVLCILVFLLGTVGHVPIFARFFNGDILTLNGRTYLWQALLDHFDPTQLLGNGLQASQTLLTNLQVSDKGIGVIGTVSHNLFLATLYDHGIIGLTLLLLVFIALSVSLIAGIRKSTGDHRMLFVTSLAVLFSALLQFLASNDLWNQEIGIYFWIIMALPFALYWFTPGQTVETLDGIGFKTIGPHREPLQHTGRDLEQLNNFVKGCIRICFISFNFSPVVGGAEIQTERQARQQQDFGNESIIVTLRLDKHWLRTETLNGLPVVRVGGVYTFNGRLRTGKLGHLPIAVAMLLTLWRLRHRYDLIHVAQMSPSAVVAALIGKLTQKPVIISIQSTGPGETQRRQLKQGAMLMADTLTDTNFLKLGFQDWSASGEGDITALARLSLGGSAVLNFLRNSNACYHVASTRCHSYLTSHGFRAEQIIHISPGIDTEKFQPISNRYLDPTQPERDIICVARLDYAKGIDVLLHAWGRVMHTPAEWLADLKPRLRLVGDGLLRPQLERIVAELGLQDSVEFLGQRTDIVDLLQHSWGFVLPSRWEGLSNALLEAMACGLPCLATRVSGSEDVIDNDVNGLLVEPEEPVEMAHALCRILADADLAHRIGLAARTTAVQDYQLMRFARRFQELYQRLLTKN